jgi:hypothetical protein
MSENVVTKIEKNMLRGFGHVKNKLVRWVSPSNIKPVNREENNALFSRDKNKRLESLQTVLVLNNARGFKIVFFSLGKQCTIIFLA